MKKTNEQQIADLETCRAKLSDALAAVANSGFPEEASFLTDLLGALHEAYRWQTYMQHFGEMPVTTSRQKPIQEEDYPF